ncbi:choline O-acetyltransferase-like isoform X2 [Centruroides sculpturatus]|uniref:choline O-acetyltransferase-like isoform X2 n=1 Tax=Centruroides sculpturatus TaxID=218467 RepID=UPI000C6D768C|nr:choline O-acetyltransferase-like isoform X2 [Centruroides sculpturatus]
MSNEQEKQLPKPLIPELSHTLQRFLEGIKTIVTEEEYKEAENLVKEFQNPGGEGEKLQNFLKEYAEKNDDYLTRVWTEEMYLNNRLPLPIYTNPFILLPKQNFRGDNDRFSFIAKFIIFCLKFKQKLESGELKQELKQESDSSMANYYRFFNVYRRPGEEKDEHVYTDNSRHVIVICNNQFFMLLLPEKCIPSEKNLGEKLKEIQDQSKTAPAYKPIGILTAHNRQQWSELRKDLIKSEINKQSITHIENCLFVVCMDESIESLEGQKYPYFNKFSDQNLEIMANHVLHGNKSIHSTANRWFDVFLQFIVTKDGTNGICMEPSVVDGSSMLRFCEQFLAFLKTPQSESEDAENVTVSRIHWEIHKSFNKKINDIKESIDTLIEQVDLNIVKFTNFGKNFIKQQKINPDIFLQLSLQMTYFRIYRYFTSTFETASLHQFRFGRIDNIRSANEDVWNLMESIFRPFEKGTDKRDKFTKAINKQEEILSYTMKGEGPDNHLLCLKHMAALKGLPEPAFFKSHSYRQFIDFRLCFSQITTNQDIIMGYCPSALQGYACTYILHDNDITFFVSSGKNDKKTNTKNFANCWMYSLTDLKQTWEYCNSLRVYLP